MGALSGGGGGGGDKRAAVHSPASLLAAVVKVAPQFRGRQQQDAHELLRLLLDGVSGEEGKRAEGAGAAKKKAGAASAAPRPPPSASPSFAERVFGGQLASCLACGCGAASSSLEAFMDLSLPVPTTVRPGPAGVAASALPPKPARSAAPLTANPFPTSVPLPSKALTPSKTPSSSLASRNTASSSPSHSS